MNIDKSRYRFDAVIFDFDGTLADTKEGIINGAQYALSCCGIDCSINDERLKKFVGPTLWYSFENFFHLDEDTVNQAILHYREYYRTKGMYQASLYVGVFEMLKRLEESPIKTGIASAKHQHTVEESLTRYGVSTCFDTVYGSLSKGIRSDKAELLQLVLDEWDVIDKNRVLFVGDSRGDAIGAIETDLLFAAALYDRSADEFDGLSIQYAVHSIAELEQLIFMVV